MDENKERSLLAIPTDIIEKHLSPLLGLKELSRLTRTYKTGNYFLKSFQEAKSTRVLEFVAFGKQEEANKIISK